LAEALNGKTSTRADGKIPFLPEQTGSVAEPSQSAIITRPALPRSNQIHAMMFGLLFDNSNGDHRL